MKYFTLDIRGCYAYFSMKTMVEQERLLLEDIMAGAVEVERKGLRLQSIAMT